MKYLSNFVYRSLFLLADLVGITLAFTAAYFLKFDNFELIVFSRSYYSTLLLFSLFSWLVLSLYFEHTKSARTAHKHSEHQRNFLFAQFIFNALLTIVMVFTNFFVISRLFLGIFIIFQLLILSFNNIIRHKVTKSMRIAGRNLRYLALIGTANENHSIEKWVHSNPQLGFVFVNKFPTLDDKNFNLVSWISIFSRFENKTNLDHILISHACPRETQKTVVNAAEDAGARVHLIQKIPKTLIHRTNLDYFGPFPIESIRAEPLRKRGNRIIKRSFDLLFSTVVLVGIYSWFYLLVGLLIKITSKGTILIRQNRPGIDSNVFDCYKFRTMTYDPISEKGEGEITKVNDSRITTIGSFLRKTNLDELPQFINVLIGDMSVIGPRPLPIKEDREVRLRLKKYPLRQFIKPGITGYAAINGFRGSTPDLDLMQKRVDLDIWYVERWSIWLDLKICAITVWQMITFKTGAH